MKSRPVLPGWASAGELANTISANVVAAAKSASSRSVAARKQGAQSFAQRMMGGISLTRSGCLGWLGECHQAAQERRSPPQALLGFFPIIEEHDLHVGT